MIIMKDKGYVGHMKEYLNAQKKRMVKRVIAMALLMIAGVMTCACHENAREDVPQAEQFYDDPNAMYADDAEKQEWYEAIVKLISNQQAPYGENGEIMGYRPPRPDEPSIAYGLDMGLFDVTNDGVPELLLNMGGGSAGNDYFYVYDIFTGEVVAQIDGGGEDSWATYYDIENRTYLPIGRYDWRSGDLGSMHFLNTVAYNADEQAFLEISLFYAAYEYRLIPYEDPNGEYVGFDSEIAHAEYSKDGESCGFQSYHYRMTEFYQTHSLVPGTGLKLYYWSDVSEEQDSARVRAEKMAHMLLYGSGQRFVHVREQSTNNP